MERGKRHKAPGGGGRRVPALLLFHLFHDDTVEQLQAAKKAKVSDKGEEASEADETTFLDRIKAPWEWEMFRPKPPPPPADQFVLRGDKLEAEKAPKPGTAEADLAGAEELYRQGDFDKARRIFHRLAENTRNTVQVADKSRFYEAECYRRDKNYPRAADTYIRLLNDFPSSSYKDQAVQHLYEIANYWLDSTREEMRQERERREGKRWVVWPHFVHFDKTRPLLDEEGRAMQALEQVQINDVLGQQHLADKALFLLGSVHFFNENYKEADYFFTQLVQNHKESELAPQAIELGIIAKHMSTGGSDYDGRKVAEARQLVDTALANYPKLREKKQEFLSRQLVGITLQQAEKDWKMAEFYRKQGHPGSAYFYYEIVRRRYPGTKYAELSTQRMWELRAKVEKEQRDGVTPPPAPQPVVPGAPLRRQEETAPLPRPYPGGNGTETAPPPRTLPGGLDNAPGPRTLPGGP